MADIERDAWLNRRLKGLRLADHVYSDPTIRWGEFIEPTEDPRPQPLTSTLRLAVIGSMPIGFMTLKTLIAYAAHFPQNLHIVCLLTDDPANPDAKIGVKKRHWHIYPEEERRRIEFETVKSAIGAGIPVYTGDIKQDWFRNILSGLKPDAALCCGFGQILDALFLKIPCLGVYNIHPTDLANGYGAGPAPYEDSKVRNARTMCWTVHLMNEEVDAGPIVGSSPAINIRYPDGTFPGDQTEYYSKIIDGLDYLVFHTIDTLVAWHQRRQTTPIAQIEYDALFPDIVKHRMLEPIREFPAYTFPAPSLFAGTET